MVGNYIIAPSLKWWLNRREQYKDRQWQVKHSQWTLCFIYILKLYFSTHLEASDVFHVSWFNSCARTIQAFHWDTDPSEWDLLEWECHVANCDNCFAQGTVAPVLAVLHRTAICIPHVREQQPTWWQIIGKGRGLEWEPGSKPSEINLHKLN